MGRHAVDRDTNRAAAVAAYHEVVVPVPGLKVERRQSTRRLLGEDLLGVGEHVEVLLVPGEDELDGPLLPANRRQGFHDVQRHDQARLHVQDAGAVGHAVLVDAEGVFPGRALFEHGVHVPDEQQGGLAALHVPLADEHVSRVLHGDGPGMDARRLHLLAQDAADLVHALNLAASALRVHQLLPQQKHGLALSVDVLTDLLVNLLHSILLYFPLTACSPRSPRSAQRRS